MRVGEAVYTQVFVRSHHLLRNGVVVAVDLREPGFAAFLVLWARLPVFSDRVLASVAVLAVGAWRQGANLEKE